jgi:hypothetical protein
MNASATVSFNGTFTKENFDLLCMEVIKLRDQRIEDLRRINELQDLVIDKLESTIPNRSSYLIVTR